MSARRTPTALSVQHYTSGQIALIDATREMPIAVMKADEREGIDPRATAQLLSAAPQMMAALEAIAMRFPLEYQTTLTECACNQFADQNECRHLSVLYAIRKAKGTS